MDREAGTPKGSRRGEQMKIVRTIGGFLRQAFVKRASGVVTRRLRQYRRDRPRPWNVAPSDSWQPGALRSETNLDALESGALFIPFSGAQSANPRIPLNFGKPEIRPAEFTTSDPAVETDSRS